MTNLRQDLEVEVARFRAWADTFPVAERSGEWETLYRDWQAIYDAFRTLGNGAKCQEWDEELTQMVLYIIARDNEMQELAKEVAKHLDNLICLSELALVSSERDAKWQLAAELGHANHKTPQVESLLLQFAHDPDEYVRRRSLIALADIGSSQIEALAASAWEADDENQRAAALYALWKSGSPQLDTYLMQAEAGLRQYFAAYVARTQDDNPEE